MHPEINKFWEEQYGSVYFDGYYYFQFNNETGVIRAEIWKEDSEGNVTLRYYFYGWRTEQEMLKLINLKMFL